MQPEETETAQDAEALRHPDEERKPKRSALLDQPLPETFDEAVREVQELRNKVAEARNDAIKYRRRGKETRDALEVAQTKADGADALVRETLDNASWLIRSVATDATVASRTGAAPGSNAATALSTLAQARVPERTVSGPDDLAALYDDIRQAVEAVADELPELARPAPPDPGISQGVRSTGIATRATGDEWLRAEINSRRNG